VQVQQQFHQAVLQQAEAIPHDAVCALLQLEEHLLHSV
jgi:hypothetical protein